MTERRGGVAQGVFTPAVSTEIVLSVSITYDPSLFSNFIS